MTDKEIAVDFIQKKINKLTWNLEDDSHHLELFGDYTHYKTDAGHFRALSLCLGLELILKYLEVLEILKDKEVDVNFFKTLIPFHKEEDLMINYNATHWKGKLTLEETIKIKRWLENEKSIY